MILFRISCILCLVSLFCLDVAPSGEPSYSWVVLMLSMTVVCFVIWARATGSERDGNWFHPVPLMTLAYIIVFYQVPLCVALELDISEYQCPFPEKINDCATMSFMGYSFFSTSYLIGMYAVRKHRRKGGRVKRRARVFLSDPSGLKLASDYLLVINWCLFIAFAVVVGRGFILEFTYSAGGNWGGGASYLNLLLELTKGPLLTLTGARVALARPSSFFQYCFRYDRRVLLFIFVTNAPFMLAGDRGSIILASCFFAGPYFLLVKPLRFAPFIKGAVVASVLMVFVGKSRTRDESESMNSRIAKGLDAVKLMTMSPDKVPTMELATSYNCFNAAVGIVPTEYPYAVGLYHWNDFSMAIPFYRRFVPLGDDYVGAGSLFFTSYLRKGDMNAGAGSSCLGMIYLDFGWKGIPPSMAIFGFLLGCLGWMVRVPSQNAIYWQFLFYFALHQGLRTPRQDPYVWVQTVAWEGIIFVLFIRPILLKGKRRSSARP